MGIIVNLKFIRGIGSDIGRLLFERNEDIICLMRNIDRVSITNFFAYNCYFFFLLIFLLTIPYFFYIRFYIYAITCEILSINLFLLINRLISELLHFLFKLHSLFWNQLECM